MKMLKVAVLHGGPSTEHDISVWSAKGVIAALRAGGHDAHAVYVDREGWWHFGGESSDAGQTSNNRVRLWNAVELLEELGFAVCFMGFHGTYGEDGKIQAALDLAGVRYTGSGVTASAVAMDKPLARRVFTGAGIQVARAIELPAQGLSDLASARVAAARLIGELGLPVVVKVPAGGSSVGVEIPKTEGDLCSSLQRLSEGVAHLLCEQYVAGTELTAGVIENSSGVPHALPIVEIRPVADEFFTLAAKYNDNGSLEIVPAQISAQATQQAQDLGLRAHAALGCRGVSRTDMILRADGQIVVLETNTLPGLTSASLLPRAAAAAGHSYLALLEMILAAALR